MSNMERISISRRCVITFLILLLSFSTNAHIGQKMNEIALAYYDKELRKENGILIVESNSATAYFGFDKQGHCDEIAIIPKKGYETSVENHFWTCSEPFQGTKRIFGEVDGKTIYIEMRKIDDQTIYYIHR